MSFTFELTDLGKQMEAFLEAPSVEMEAGFLLTGESYEDGELIADVAFDNEYGVIQNNQPPRPFMRPTLLTNHKKWINFVKASVPGMFKGGLDIEGIFDVLGETVVSDIQNSINRVHRPKLAPMTLALRRERGNNSDKPLEDTMLMFNSIDHEVRRA